MAQAISRILVFFFFLGARKRRGRAMTLDLISDEWNTARQDAAKDTKGNFG